MHMRYDWYQCSRTIDWSSLRAAGRKSCWPLLNWLRQRSLWLRQRSTNVVLRACKGVYRKFQFPLWFCLLNSDSTHLNAMASLCLRCGDCAWSFMLCMKRSFLNRKFCSEKIWFDLSLVTLNQILFFSKPVKLKLEWSSIVFSKY